MGSTFSGLQNITATHSGADARMSTDISAAAALQTTRLFGEIHLHGG